MTALAYSDTTPTVWLSCHNTPEILQSNSVTTASDRPILSREILAQYTSSATANHAIAAHREELRWEGYLSELVQSGACSEVHVRAVRSFCQATQRYVRANHGRMSTPQAGLSDDGFLQMVWDVGEHHLEADIKQNRLFDWFYRNRRTGDYDGDEDCSVRNVPARLLSYCLKVVE